jgi:hypothetical protein
MCCRTFAPALPENPAASVRDYCSAAYSSDHVADADRILTAVSHVADLTEALREAYLANFPGEQLAEEGAR